MSIPVIAGLYPDPTVCRVDDVYYLATSSMEYHPALPLFTSRDLVTWTSIGNALTRPSQFPEGFDADSAGIYSPTLRHHDGVFWLIVTNMSTPEAGQQLHWATDAGGPWSDPLFIPGALGIDPDLAWDAEGTCYLTWSELDLATGRATIQQAILDVQTGELLERWPCSWTGTGMRNPESPHLFQRKEWWYLVIAEGGTERGHSVSIARGPGPRGPFMTHPANPILSHRSSALPVQNTGHADFVQTTEGDWAAVYLGVRPRGITPGFHVNGREVFAAGIEWNDGWPAFDESRYAAPFVDHSFSDHFTDGITHPRWIAPRRHPDAFVGPADRGVSLLAADSAQLLCFRVRDHEWTASAVVDPGENTARLCVRMDDQHWYAIEADARSIRVRVSLSSFEHTVVEVARSAGEIRLWIIAEPTPPNALFPGTDSGPDRIHLGFGELTSGGLATLDGRYLSTEVAGGFTGRVVGIGAIDGPVELHSVSYLSQ
jgi:xylan 1,4-beta-xylosidase